MDSRRHDSLFIITVVSYQVVLPSCSLFLIYYRVNSSFRIHISSPGRLRTTETVYLQLASDHQDYTVAIDASNTPVEDVLQHWVRNKYTPLAFFSKRLQAAETRHSTFGRELLAIYLVIKHFRHVVEGRAFTIFTDHLCNPLAS